MDRDEYLNADWYAIGLEDGARGRAVERLGDHRRACARHNVTPSTERYLAGRSEGLKTFCMYERGFAEGRSGRGYQRGRELYELQRQLDEVNRELAHLKTTLKEGIPNPRTRSAARSADARGGGARIAYRAIQVGGTHA